MPEDAVPSFMQAVVIFCVTAGVWCVVLVVSYLVGMWNRQHFSGVAVRRGRIGVVDLIVGLLLWFGGQLIGQIVGIGWAERVFGEVDLTEPFSDPRVGTVLLVSSMVGSLLGVVYVVARAAASVEGGAGAFGFSLRRPLWMAGWSIGGSVAIVFLTMMFSMMMGAVAILLDIDAPEVAHDMLVVMMETESARLRWTLILVAVVAAPVVEEIVFRGLVQTTLIQFEWLRDRRWVLILIASCFFAVIHLGAVHWFAMPMLVVLAIGLGYLYERTGRLWPSIAVHVAFNGVMVGLTLLRQVLLDSIG